MTKIVGRKSLCETTNYISLFASILVYPRDGLYTVWFACLVETVALDLKGNFFRQYLIIKLAHSPVESNVWINKYSFLLPCLQPPIGISGENRFPVEDKMVIMCDKDDWPDSIGYKPL